MFYSPPSLQVMLPTTRAHQSSLAFTRVLCCFSAVTLQIAKTNKEIMNVCTLKASHGPSPANTSPSRAQIQLLHNLISTQKQSGRRYKGSLKARFIKGIFIWLLFFKNTALKRRSRMGFHCSSRASQRQTPLRQGCGDGSPLPPTPGKPLGSFPG